MLKSLGKALLLTKYDGLASGKQQPTYNKRWEICPWDPENQRGALGTSPCLPRDVTRPPSPPPPSPFFPRFSPSVTQPPCNPSLPPHSSLSPRSSVFHGEEQNSTRALRANLRASPLRDSNSQGQRRRPPQCSR